MEMRSHLAELLAYVRHSRVKRLRPEEADRVLLEIEFWCERRLR